MLAEEIGPTERTAAVMRQLRAGRFPFVPKRHCHPMRAHRMERENSRDRPDDDSHDLGQEIRLTFALPIHARSLELPPVKAMESAARYAEKSVGRLAAMNDQIPMLRGWRPVLASRWATTLVAVWS